MRRRRTTIEVQIDVDDVLDGMDDEDIIAEARVRKIFDKIEYDDMRFIRLAHEELLRGRASAALALLDRIVGPKTECPGNVLMVLPSGRTTA